MLLTVQSYGNIKSCAERMTAKSLAGMVTQIVKDKYLL